MLDTPLQSDHTADREALARLISSRVFARSPNLEKILVYLCHNYFEGRSNVLKEYHIATEALGRSEDFDPKKDSIVRVEMHRLRKRLKAYYASADPAVEPVRITIPEKSYIPEFQLAVQLAAVDPPVAAAAATSPADPRGLLLRWIMAGAAALVVGFAAYVILSRPPAGAGPASLQADRTAAGAAAAIEESSGPPVNPTDFVRIMAGRPPGRYTDRFGQLWDGDRFYSGGSALAVNAEVTSRGFDPNIFANMREGDFTYAIPLKPGVYEMLLLFAEAQFGERNPLGGGETSRVFSVSANGKEILRDFDAISETSDPNTATARRFRDLSPGVDGKLHLQFGPATVSRPFVNGIVISPGTPGKLRPIRIVMRPESFRDSKGSLWEPDQFYRSGKQISRPQGAPALEGDTFRGERYGNFSYHIPVPSGIYGARLHFWEYWWGPNQPGKGGVGSRIFDVFCNHKPLLIDLDIIKQEPKNQFVTHTFHGLTPNPQGKLVFDFTSKVNYALINAIEIFDETGK